MSPPKQRLSPSKPDASAAKVWRIRLKVLASLVLERVRAGCVSKWSRKAIDPVFGERKPLGLESLQLMPISHRTLLLLAWIVLPLSTRADVVETNDGAHLTGTILEINPDSIVLETSYAGELTIVRTAVTAIATDSERFVAFTDGTRVRGLVSTEDGQVVVGNESRPLGEIANSWQPGQIDPEVAAVEALRRRWRYEFDLGLQGKSGNSEQFGIDTGANAWLEGPRDTLRFYGRYRYAETNDEISQDEVRGGFDYEQDFYEGLLWFLRGEMGRDTVEALELYTETAGGFGYKFLNRENWKLTGRAGAAYRYESYESGASESYPGVDVGLAHRFELDWVTAMTELGVVFSVTDAQDYIATHRTTLDFAILDTNRWTLRAGLENKYDNKPSGDNEKLDTTYSTSIVLSLD